jgi:hypothetical protein
MIEERMHTILFAATLLCVRKLLETMDSDKPNFAPKCKGCLYNWLHELRYG